MAFLTQEEAERFAAKTEWVGQCLIWTGCKQSEGYGKVTVRGKQWRTHRLAYADAWGPIPDGMVVRHRCDNPSCVNPAHLEIGTNADNAKDKAVRRRARVKLSEEQVRAIRTDPRTMQKIAKQHGVSPAAVCLIKSGQRRQYVGG